MNEKIKVIEGGVTAAKGFMAASTAAGIKYKNRQDMAMIYSKEPCKSAGTFTTNLVKAAPVKWDKNQVTSGADAQAVIINAGIANACTGEEGMGYCAQTAKAAAETFGSRRRFSCFYRCHRYAASNRQDRSRCKGHGATAW